MAGRPRLAAKHVGSGKFLLLQSIHILAMVQGEGCFCFDIKTFHIQVGTLTPNTLRLYNGLNPLASSLSATFVMNGDYDVSRGWVRICAPIVPSDGVNIPSNADGQWVMNTGGAAAWDTL